MKVYERVFDMVAGLEQGDWRMLEEHEYEYFGLVMQCKKGRESQAQVTQQALQNSQADQATRQAQLALTNPDIAQLDVQPGKLSQAAQAQYAQDLSNIGDTYSRAKASGLKAIGQRGLASAPTGAESSLMNSADISQAKDENSAFNTAQQQSHADMLAAINARLGLQNIYNPNQALGTASESAYRQGQQGSLLGDIGRGLTTAASLATGAQGLAKGW